MNELALFAGAGGGLLGSRLLGWRTVCYVEKDKYCVQVLQARIKDGYLDDSPIWDDIQTFDGRPWAGRVDVVTAGFPCQPFSRAGKKLGHSDERNLWPHTARIIREIAPAWILLENVSRLLSFDYFGQILGDLASSGYDAEWDCIPASAVGANHQRDRLWIVAVSNCRRQQGGKEFNGESQEHSTDRSTRRRHVGGCSNEISYTTEHRCAGNLYEPKFDRQVCSGDDADAGSSQTTDANSQRFEKQRRPIAATTRRTRILLDAKPGDWWKVEPGLGRVVDGMANRVDRLRAIGNGQVPAVVKAAWLLLSGVDAA